MIRNETSPNSELKMTVKTLRLTRIRLPRYPLSCLLSQEATQKNAGVYKCMVTNEFGEVNANLTLNIQIAPEDEADGGHGVAKEATLIAETTTVRKTSTSVSMSAKRKKSVLLQCSVSSPDPDVKVEWFKEGKAIMATNEQTRESRYSVERKVSEQNAQQTIVQLEIQDATIMDSGQYELVATSALGEQQSQTITLTQEQIQASLEVEETKKKKKKIVKKKKVKKEEKKEAKVPEISSFLKSLVSCLSMLDNGSQMELHVYMKCKSLFAQLRLRD